MKRILGLFLLISSFVYSQDLSLCEQCVEQNGFYCGDDPANWTQYAPDGCVINGWLNDGWEDCVDASDENEAEPTTLADCESNYAVECDTVYIDVPIIEYVYEWDTLEVPVYIYETILQLDTIIQTEYITNIVIDTFEVETFIPEYINVIDTLWMEGALDTLFIDVIEYVDIIVTDTIIETEYVEFFVTDTIVQYEEIIITEYLDCETGMPCDSGMMEALDKSKTNNVIYNIMGQPIIRPEGIYIQHGEVKYRLNR